MITPDYLIDRDRLKKQLINWRAVAFASLSLLILLMLMSIPGPQQQKTLLGTKYIARVNVHGVIQHDLYTIEALKNLSKDHNVKGVIVFVNSPGGTVVGGEALYHSIRKLSLSKPVVAVMGDIATSAGYMTAIAADYIIAYQGTLTGSIGVLLQSFEATELAQKLGVKFHTFKSSPLKAAPLPTEELTPEARQVIYENIYDVYDMFLGLVAERRNIQADQLKVVGDGRIYTGRQALAMGLIDKLGDEEDAVKWLEETKKIEPNLRVQDYAIVKEISSFDRILDSLADVSLIAKNAVKNRISSFL